MADELAQSLFALDTSLGGGYGDCARNIDNIAALQKQIKKEYIAAANLLLEPQEIADIFQGRKLISALLEDLHNFEVKLPELTDCSLGLGDSNKWKADFKYAESYKYLAPQNSN